MIKYGALFYVFLFIFLTNKILNAQNSIEKYSLGGTVIDSQANKPLIGVSVIVFSRLTGKEMKGVATDENGIFNIDNISEKEVLVKFSMIGYQSQVFDSVRLDEFSKLGFVRLLATTIEIPEVVIKSIKPPIEFRVDRQVINMDSFTSNSSTIMEVLRNSGLVEVDQSSNNMTVRGQIAKIQMDAHEFNLPVEMLAQIPSTVIERVEIIFSPGAKESAEDGTYIVNLISRKETYGNYSGMLSMNISTNDKISGGTYLNYKANKLNLFIQSFGNRVLRKSISEGERIIYSDPSLYYQKTTGDINGTTKSGNIKLGLDYGFDENNVVTFFLNYVGYSSYFENKNNSLVNDKKNTLLFTYNKNNNNNNANTNISLYAFYKKKIAAKEHELIIDVMYTHLTNPSELKMKLDFSNKVNQPELQNSNTNVLAKIFIFKTDYIFPIENNRFEVGYNLTCRSRNNEYHVNNYLYTRKSWLDSLKLSNAFKYIESINAFYITHSRNFDDLDVKFGFRTEYLRTEGIQVTQSIRNSENYLSFFPSIDISYLLSETLQLNFNAFRRVIYPQISNINPFRYHLGLNNYSTGNPQIKPTFTNAVTLSLSPYISLFYYYTKGALTSAMTTENDSTIISTALNLGLEKSCGFNIILPFYNHATMPFRLPDFISSCNISINYYHTKQTGFFINEDLSIIEKNYSLNSNLDLKLWWNIEANLAFSYTPKIENRREIIGKMFFSSLYLSKTLMDGKLRLFIKANDLFNSSKNYYESKGNNYYIKGFNKILNSRYLEIGISYLFNDYKKRRDRKIDDERDVNFTNDNVFNGK